MNEILIAILKARLKGSIENLPNDALAGEVYHIISNNKVYIGQEDGSWYNLPFIDKFVWALDSQDYFWTPAGLIKKPVEDNKDYSTDLANLRSKDDELSKLIKDIESKISNVTPSLEINTRSVKTFGAKGDGVTDDSSAFRQAFAWMIAEPGRSIEISPAKGYRLASKINIDSARLRIQGKVISSGMSSPIIVDFNGPVFSFSALTYNIEFESLCAYPSKTVSTNTLTDALFHFPNGNCDSNFLNCRYDTNPDNGNKGATFYYCAAGKLMDGINFTNCYAYNRACNYHIGSGSSVYIIGGRGVGNFPQDFSYGLKLTGNMGGIFVTQTDFIAHGEGVRHGNEIGQTNREIFYTQVCTDGCFIGRNILDSSYTSDQGVWSASCDEANINFYPESDAATYVINGGTIFNAGAFGRSGSAFGISLNHKGRILCAGVDFKANKGRAISVNNATRPFYSVFSNCTFISNGDTKIANTCQIQLVGRVKLEGGSLVANGSVPSLVIDPGSSSLVKVKSIEGLADKL